jgi:hypothetical protein
MTAEWNAEFWKGQRRYRTALCIAGLIALSGAPAWAGPPTRPSCFLTPHGANNWMTGTFDTSFGQLTVTPKGGTYTVGNGQLRAVTTQCVQMTGIWVQSTSAHQCPNGQYYGKFKFDFTHDSFTGTFGYCDGPLTGGAWNGKRLW